MGKGISETLTGKKQLRYCLFIYWINGRWKKFTFLKKPDISQNTKFLLLLVDGYCWDKKINLNIFDSFFSFWDRRKTGKKAGNFFFFHSCYEALVELIYKHTVLEKKNILGKEMIKCSILKFSFNLCFILETII